MITSVKNSRIKLVRAMQARSKTRREEGAFIVEGVRLSEEAVAAGWQPRLCLYTAGLHLRGLQLVDELRTAGAEVEEVAEHVMQAASDTQTPQGILLVVAHHPLPMPEAANLVLILDRVQDPGNLGTLMRTAWAAGVDAVLLTEGSVDPFSPKVVRSGMGAHFHLPVDTHSPEAIAEICRIQQLTLWTAAAGEGAAYTEANLADPAALIIGSEAHGVGDVLTGEAKPLHIPMPGGSESLNAAVAGAILLFEAVRQRRAG
jgi:TrmH family RNA methyltransferase